MAQANAFLARYGSGVKAGNDPTQSGKVTSPQKSYSQPAPVNAQTPQVNTFLNRYGNNSNGRTIAESSTKSQVAQPTQNKQNTTRVISNNSNGTQTITNTNHRIVDTGYTGKTSYDDNVGTYQKQLEKRQKDLQNTQDLIKLHGNNPALAGAVRSRKQNIAKFQSEIKQISGNINSAKSGQQTAITQQQTQAYNKLNSLVKSGAITPQQLDAELRKMGKTRADLETQVGKIEDSFDKYGVTDAQKNAYQKLDAMVKSGEITSDQLDYELQKMGKTRQDLIQTVSQIEQAGEKNTYLEDITARNQERQNADAQAQQAEQNKTIEANASKFATQFAEALQEFAKTGGTLTDGQRDKLLAQVLQQNGYPVDWNDPNFKTLVDSIYGKVIGGSGQYGIKDWNGFYNKFNTKYEKVAKYADGSYSGKEILNMKENGTLTSGDIQLIGQANPDLIREYKEESEFKRITDDAMNMANEIMTRMERSSLDYAKQQSENLQQETKMFQQFAITQQETLSAFVSDFEQGLNNESKTDYVTRMRSLLNTDEINTKTQEVNGIEKEIDDLRLEASEIEDNIREELAGNATESYIQALVTKRTKQLIKKENLLLNRYEQASGDLSSLTDSAKQDFQLAVQFEQEQKEQDWKLFSTKYQISQDSFDKQWSILTDSVTQGRAMDLQYRSEKLQLDTQLLGQAFTQANQGRAAEIQEIQADNAFARSQVLADQQFERQQQLADTEYGRQLERDKIGYIRELDQMGYQHELNKESSQIEFKNEMEKFNQKYESDFAYQKALSGLSLEEKYGMLQLEREDQIDTLDALSQYYANNPSPAEYSIQVLKGEDGKNVVLSYNKNDPTDVQEIYSMGGASSAGGATGLLEYISSSEGTHGNYNAVFGNGGQSKVDLTGMTINQVKQFQKDSVYKDKNGNRVGGAMGKYQIVTGTLNSLVKNMGLSGNELFDEQMQDKMAMQLLGGSYDAYVAGTITQDQLQKKVSGIWAGVPNPYTNQSTYHSDGTNRARPDNGAFAKALKGSESVPERSNMEIELINTAQELKDIGLIKRGISSTGGIAGRDSRNVKTKFDYIKDTLSLQNLITLKGEGATFGALSNNELQYIANSATKLDLLSDKDTRNKELNKIITIMSGESPQIVSNDYEITIDESFEDIPDFGDFHSTQVASGVGFNFGSTVQ